MNAATTLAGLLNYLVNHWADITTTFLTIQHFFPSQTFVSKIAAQVVDGMQRVQPAQNATINE